jgi:drug/metabolite transporter (DMT)-like permease
MSGSIERRGSFAVLAAALLWSTGGLFIKEVSLNAWGVSFWRSSFAAITIFIIYFLRTPSFSRRGQGVVSSAPSPWFSPFILLSALCYALLLVLFVFATKLTTSANAIFLQYTAPIYVLFIEPMLSHTKMKRADLATVAISTAAMALFFIGKFEPRGVWGNIAALASGVAFATYALILKHERATEQSRWQIVIVGHIMIAGAMAIVAVTGHTNLSVSSGDFTRLLYLGIVQIGIAYAFFTYGISHIRAIDATLIAMVEPVLNPIWVFLGIGERPANFALLGGVIILSLSIFRTIRGTRETIELEKARAGE